MKQTILLFLLTATSVNAQTMHKAFGICGKYADIFIEQRNCTNSASIKLVRFVGVGSRMRRISS